MSELGFKPGLLIPSSWFFPQKRYIPKRLDPRCMLELISSRNDRYMLNDMPTPVVLSYLVCVLGRTREPIVGSVGKGTTIDSWCLPQAPTPGAFQPQPSSLPPFLQMGKLMLEILKELPKGTQHSVGRATVSFPFSWLRTWSTWPSPGLPLEFSRETCQITHSLWIAFWPCFPASYQICTSSGQLWREIQCEMLACDWQWDSSVKVSIEELLRGACYPWLMDTEFWCWDWMSKCRTWSRNNQSQLSI